MRYFLHIAYNGTRYHGWQKQINAHTVQEEIEKALCTLYNVPAIETTGCGRTDAGVHAKDFYLHFDIENLRYTGEELVFKLNRILSKDIAVFRIIPLHDDAHARFDATSRQYEYHVHHAKNPFLQETSTHWHRVPDYDKMNKAAALLLSYSDFASFCKANAGNATTLCKVTEAEWKKKDEEMVFYISADRFLRNMVRAVVGTLMQVGYNDITIYDFRKIIESKKRTEAGDSVPPQGLTLSKVIYPYI